MKLKEKNALISHYNSLSDEELEKEYYDSVFDCLGSDVDEMYERGYCIEDILERESYEKYLSEKCDILEGLCLGRNIKLWENHNNDIDR